jgi:hypothetical protein
MILAHIHIMGSLLAFEQEDIGCLQTNDITYKEERYLWCLCDCTEFVYAMNMGVPRVVLGICIGWCGVLGLTSDVGVKHNLGCKMSHQRT